jgi:hypothetical protein
MGLRIIDRKRPPHQPPPHPDELKKELESVTSEWIQRRGSALPLKSVEEFVEQFHQVKNRVPTQDEAFSIVKHMSSKLKSGWSVGFQPHQKVDVATLLVLL